MYYFQWYGLFSMVWCKIKHGLLECSLKFIHCPCHFLRNIFGQQEMVISTSSTSSEKQEMVISTSWSGRVCCLAPLHQHLQDVL